MFSGLEEAVYRNISACKEFAQSVRSAYGPNGMNKMVINHLDKQFVTSDAGTIIRELDVEHPAVKLMVLASQMQEAEMGDGTNWVVIFCGALLEEADELLRLGVTTSEIVEGYEKALQKALDILPSLVCHEVKDVHEIKAVQEAMRGAIMSKQYGNEDFLTNLISKACVSILPEDTTFNVDNIRVCKVRLDIVRVQLWGINNCGGDSGGSIFLVVPMNNQLEKLSQYHIFQFELDPTGSLTFYCSQICGSHCSNPCNGFGWCSNSSSWNIPTIY